MGGMWFLWNCDGVVGLFFLFLLVVSLVLV